MRNINIAKGEYYHVFNRGNGKQNIFLRSEDWGRLLFSILILQSDSNINHFSRLAYQFTRGQHSVLTTLEQDTGKGRYVDLVSFCLMPNHFHLLLKEHQAGGISKYMQRVLNSYTKYANTKYEKSGHLFQGPYKFVHVKDNEQLLYLSAYIHRNPYELREWKGKEERYPWSSFQDYVTKNRWGNFIRPDIVLGQYKNSNEYKRSVDESGAKEKDFEDKDILIDTKNT